MNNQHISSPTYQEEGGAPLNYPEEIIRANGVTGAARSKNAAKIVKKRHQLWVASIGEKIIKLKIINHVSAHKSFCLSAV